jgi:hypothetical protein
MVKNSIPAARRRKERKAPLSWRPSLQVAGIHGAPEPGPAPRRALHADRAFDLFGCGRHGPPHAIGVSFPRRATASRDRGADYFGSSTTYAVSAF